MAAETETKKVKKYRVIAGVAAGFFQGEIITEDALGGPDAIPRFIELRAIVEHEPVEEVEEVEEVQTEETDAEAKRKAEILKPTGDEEPPTNTSVGPESAPPAETQTSVGMRELPEVKRPQITQPQPPKA
jgi:hypothetical protein